jgi:hypothetical protein
MTKVNRFEEFECRKEARTIVKLIYVLRKKDPIDQKYIS